MNPATLLKGQAGLLIYGIIAILLGALSGCMGLFVPVSLIAPTMPGAPRMQAGPIIGAAVLYLAVGGGSIWLGVGSIRKRRWVRPIVLAVMSLVLVFGVFGTIAMVFTASGIQAAIAAGPGPTPPRAFTNVIVAFSLVVPAVLLIGIPAAFILFYRKPELRATLEYFDPKPRWTDSCPIPVLVVSAALAMFGGMMLITIPQGFALFCGRILTGPAAMGVLAAEGAVALLLAYLTAKLRPAGWWGAIALVVFFAAAVIPTSLHSDPADLYARAGYSAEQVKMMRQFNMFGGRAALFISVPGILVSLGYLLYVRKFFFPPRGPQGESAMTNP